MQRDPIVQTVPISQLRPTQITVGLREVGEKRRHWAGLSAEHRAGFIGSHLVPVMLGPKGRHYVTDHHHLVRALHDEGAKSVLVTIVSDLSGLDQAALWIYADNRGWCHPYDAKGRRVDFDEIPTSIAALQDDPYRSLAGALRRAGGFAKEVTPFSEFCWADFLRRRVKAKTVVHDFATALEAAYRLAKSADAKYLPGWCGPSHDDAQGLLGPD